MKSLDLFIVYVYNTEEFTVQVPYATMGENNLPWRPHRRTRPMDRTAHGSCGPLRPSPHIPPGDEGAVSHGAISRNERDL